jgi:Thiol:disulfide interchange protein DsbD, N-terminal
MKNSHLILILFSTALAFLSAGCSGQPPNETKPVAEKGNQTSTVRTSADVVKISASAVDLSSGSSSELAIPISIQPGYHINANPATFDYLIATELTVDKSDGITFGKPVYPASEKRKFQFAEQPLAVYEGNVQIKLPIQAAPNAAKGTRSLAGHLRVQACDEEKCFPPATLQVAPGVELK